MSTDLIAAIDAAIEADGRAHSPTRVALHDARAAAVELLDAASEMAFVQLNRARVNEMGRAKQLRLRVAVIRARGVG